MPWGSAALCRNLSTDVFFDPDYEETAKKVCRDCPVREECAGEAIQSNYAFGIWGGLNHAERRRIRRIRRTAVDPTQLADGRVSVEWA